MEPDVLEREWAILTRFFPRDWRESARSQGAIERSRFIREPDQLLRLLLLHVAAGLSLRSTVARAEAAGLAFLTDVALLFRLRKSERWLQHLTQQMLADSPYALKPMAAQLAHRSIRAVDGTSLQKPGATGTSWRVHYSLRLPSLTCDFFQVTDVRGAEAFGRIPVRKGDVVLADRGYCHRKGAAHVLDQGGDIVVRLHSTGFPLVGTDGQAFDLLAAMRSLSGEVPGEWAVEFQVAKKRYRVRLCAIRKSAVAAKRATRKLERTRARKQKPAKATALEAAGYVMVLTSLPASLCTADEILELYRMRWQIELAFKRLKSLLGIGHVPKFDSASSRAWIQAKILSVLLIERLSLEARLFSPWGFPFESGESVA